MDALRNQESDPDSVRWYVPNSDLMVHLMGGHGVVLKVKVIYGYTCHKFAPDHLESIYIFLKALQRMFHKHILSHMKKDTIFTCLKITILLLSDSSLLSTECRKIANSVDYICYSCSLKYHF